MSLGSQTDSTNRNCHINIIRGSKHFQKYLIFQLCTSAFSEQWLDMVSRK